MRETEGSCKGYSSRSRRRACWPAVALALGACACAQAASLSPRTANAEPQLIGCIVVPPASDAKSSGGVGGISGAFYDAGRERLIAVSDDRARPRLLVFELRLSPELTLVLEDTVILQPPGAGRSLDAEGLAPAPGASLFVSSEGNARAAHGPRPGIFVYDREGRYRRALLLPAYYTGDARGGGLRPNAGLEGLSISPDGRRLFAIAESSLVQDGREATFGRAASVRLVVYDTEALDEPPREYAYRIDSLTAPAPFRLPLGNTGVTDVLALSDAELLVLERAFVRDALSPTPFASANTARIYRVKLEDRAEVTGLSSLAGTTPVLEKKLVLDLASVASRLPERLRRLENFEVLAFGPAAPDGTATLLVASDDNFNARQVTAVLVFSMTR